MKAYLFTNKNYCEPTSYVLQHKNKAEDEYRKKTCGCFTPKLLLKGSVMRETRKKMQTSMENTNMARAKRRNYTVKCRKVC